MSVFSGIDISAKTFDLVLRTDGKPGKSEVFQQTAGDFARVARILRKKKVERIVMEATGIYHLDLAVFLSQAGLPVAVINPLSGKRFAELKLSQTKTDAADAALLADYAETLRPALWVPPKPQYMALKDIGRQINRLIKDNVKAKNRLHALRSKTSPRILIEDLEESVVTTQSRIDRLKNAALELIESDDALRAVLPCLMAAKGVAQASAIAVLAEFVVLPKEMKAKQVVRYSGLDVRTHQSGSSVRSAGRISKAGNAYLRSALFMPALSAAQHDPHARRFKEQLVERGKQKMQANVAVMRKYLMGLWNAYRYEQPFDASKLFHFDP